MRLYTIGFEMGALSPSEGRREAEGAADARPQADLGVESRRRFLGNILTGAGAGAAFSYAYGRPEQTAAAGEPEIAADDPNTPEEQSISSLITEGNIDRLQLAETVADLIESGAIRPTYAEETHEALAETGVLAVAATGEEPRRTNMSRRALVAGLLGGTILVSAPELARAQELAFVTYNVNSNERSRGQYSGEELAKLEEAKLRPITLEEFTRMPECESPRAARLFAQHEVIIAYNKALRLRKQANGEKLEGIKPSPIITFPNWYRRPSEVSESAVAYSFFKLRDQVLIPDNNGGHQQVIKHYGVAQIPRSRTRAPHCLYWSGYLGTDREKAEAGMLSALKQA